LWISTRDPYILLVLYVVGRLRDEPEKKEKKKSLAIEPHSLVSFSH